MSPTPRHRFFGLRFALLTALLLGGWAPGRAAAAQATPCKGEHLDVSMPLNDLGGDEYIRMDGQATGFYGGLYPGGSNMRPPAHEAAGIALAEAIVPLDEAGNPDPGNGRIALISVGMSNTTTEFSAFTELVEGMPSVSPHLRLINGAYPGRTADEWVDPNAEAWLYVDEQLAAAGLTPAQVQVAWVKQALVGSGAFPGRAEVLQGALVAIAQNLKSNYPNIQIAYFSSRTRSYRYWSGLNPEPVAFETGFAVKWMIEQQLDGDPALNFDPDAGPAVAPYLSWGAYLWIDGLNPRSDGRVWLPEDLVQDCTHPSESGQAKVADMLWEFFTTDTTAAPWFTAVELDERLYLPIAGTLAEHDSPARQPFGIQALEAFLG
jgi:hypothetical protein